VRLRDRGVICGVRALDRDRLGYRLEGHP
jgi:hypothetical protein